jgi:Lar family restriction alleviation protein
VLQEQMNTEVKPCPFCGSTYTSEIPAVLGVISQAYCDACGARGPNATDGDHFELWNSRHTPWKRGKSGFEDSGETFIAVVADNYKYPRVVSGFYNEEKEFTYHEYPDDYNVYTAIPTHWMPLPKLPGTQEAE